MNEKPEIDTTGIEFYANDIFRIIHNQINLRMIEIENLNYLQMKDDRLEICELQSCRVQVPYEIPLDKDDIWVVEGVVRDLMLSHGWEHVHFYHRFVERPKSAVIKAAIYGKDIQIPLIQPERNTTLILLFA